MEGELTVDYLVSTFGNDPDNPWIEQRIFVQRVHKGFTTGLGYPEYILHISDRGQRTAKVLEREHAARENA